MRDAYRQERKRVLNTRSCFGRPENFKEGDKVIVFSPMLDERERPYHLVGYIVKMSPEKLRPEDYTKLTGDYPGVHGAEKLARYPMMIYYISPKKNSSQGKRCLAHQIQTTYERAGARRRNIDLPF